MWSIRREPLIEGLKILELVPEKLGLPSSEFLWIKGKGNRITLSINSYLGAEVYLKGHGEWPFDESIYIDRRFLIPFVLAAREIKNKAVFEFHKRKTDLHVKHGKRNSSFTSQERIKGYGDLKKIMKGHVHKFPITSDLKELLQCGNNCAVSDEVVPHKNCVYVKNKSKDVQTYATSEKVYYIGQGKLSDSNGKTSIPFPLLLINLLSADGLKEIEWVSNYVIVKFKQGIVWQAIAQEALKDFPIGEIRRAVKHSEKTPVTFTTSSRRFSKLMVRTGYYLQSQRRKDWVVDVIGTEGDQHVTVSTTLPGASFKERISTGTVKSTFKLEWPLNILDPIFEFLSTKTKKIGVEVRVDSKHGISFIQTGSFWLACPSRQE